MPLALTELVSGGIYRLQSRNLRYGVWNPTVGGFIGIREKFYHRYLFTEYHYELDEHYGTAHALELVGQLEPGIRLGEHEQEGTVCLDCGVGLNYTDSVWQHQGENSDPDHDPRPSTYPMNRALFLALEEYERADAYDRWQRGELWRGNEHHQFQLIDNDGGERMVTVDEYYHAQHETGVCMGIHNFRSPDLSGKITMTR
jgi:hypothetical protein